MSRCTTLRSLAWASASAICKVKLTASPTDRAPCCSTRSRMFYAADELEDDEVQPLVLADVIHAGDILMVEPGGRLGLDVEAAAGLVVGPLSPRQYLQGHFAVEHGVAGTEHGPHASAADIFQELEMPQPVAGQQLAELEGVGRPRRFGTGASGTRSEMTVRSSGCEGACGCAAAGSPPAGVAAPRRVNANLARTRLTHAATRLAGRKPPRTANLRSRSQRQEWTYAPDPSADERP